MLPASFVQQAVGRGSAQAHSSACCSLAWVNKEKTGAIRWTCQAWNSLLMFTPFTLGLSQLCRLYWFLTRPNCICFFVKANKQNSSRVPHKTHNSLDWQRGKQLPKDKWVLQKEKACMPKWCRVRVLPQQTRCRIKAQDDVFVMITSLSACKKSSWNSHTMSVTIDSITLSQMSLWRHPTPRVKWNTTRFTL